MCLVISVVVHLSMSSKLATYKVVGVVPNETVVSVVVLKFQSICEFVINMILYKLMKIWFKIQYWKGTIYSRRQYRDR